MKPEFSRQIFEEHSNIKFYENMSSESRVVPSGRRDGWMDARQIDEHDKADIRFSQFCERA